MQIGAPIDLPGAVSLITAGLALAVSLWTRRIFIRLAKASDQKSFDKILADLLGFLEKSKEKQGELSEAIIEHKKEAKYHMQKIGIVRFNPFAETGGDQSFVLALLNGHDNGFVISSLHGRSQTRIYAKPIVGGKGENFRLSIEESRAVELAMGGAKVRKKATK